MTAMQRQVLRRLVRSDGILDGYCDLMLETGLTSYKAVDWVLDALERRGHIIPNGHSDGYVVTENGRLALNGEGGR